MENEGGVPPFRAIECIIRPIASASAGAASCGASSQIAIHAGAASFPPCYTQNRAKWKALSCNCAQCGVQSKQNTMVKGLNVHACTNAGIRPERRQRIRSEGGGLRGDGDAGAGDYRAAGRVCQGEPRPRERRHRQQRIYHAHFAPDGESLRPPTSERKALRSICRLLSAS